jgi:hypothetical protein
MDTTSENQAATVSDQEGWPHRVILPLNRNRFDAVL